jgi:hypothetical protein
MKNLTLFPFFRLFALLFFTFSLQLSIAQTANKEVFNNAVDKINNTTIQFIHREQGRAEVANNMTNNLSYEAILKSIPADEAGSTGALCKKINEFKAKFKEDKPLDAQLNEVIKFADGKITSKHRKGNVEDFKAALETIKKDAIENAGAGGKKPETTATNTTPNATHSNTTGADTGHAIAETASNDNATPAKRKTDWLGLLSLLVGLGALGLAYLAYSKVKNIPASGGGNSMNTGNNNSNKEAIDAAMREIRRLENKLNTDVSEIKRQLEEKTGSNPTPVHADSSGSSSTATASAPAAPKETVSNYIHIPPQSDATPNVESGMQGSEPIAKFDTPKPMSEPVKHDTAPKPIAEIHQNPAPETNGVLFTEPVKPVTDLFEAPAVSHQPEPVQTVIAEEDPDLEPIVEEPFMPEKEYEDGEAVPFYMYAGLPDAHGNFELNSFTSDPVMDSVYEIEMYEDVPDKAFFSLLPNPEVIRKALMEPEVYLAPCCSYSDNPEGKRTIVLVEEGMLRKQEDKWMIYEKAKINFE